MCKCLHHIMKLQKAPRCATRCCNSPAEVMFSVRLICFRNCKLDNMSVKVKYLATKSKSNWNKLRMIWYLFQILAPALCDVFMWNSDSWMVNKTKIKAIIQVWLQLQEVQSIQILRRVENRSGQAHQNNSANLYPVQFSLLECTMHPHLFCCSCWRGSYFCSQHLYQGIKCVFSLNSSSKLGTGSLLHVNVMINTQVFGYNRRSWATGSQSFRGDQKTLRTWCLSWSWPTTL